LRFRELVKTLLADHPVHLDAASLAYFMHSFSQTDKLTFKGEVDDGKRARCPRDLTLDEHCNIQTHISTSRVLMYRIPTTLLSD
jgi:hypothetical protein